MQSRLGKPLIRSLPLSSSSRTPPASPGLLQCTSSGDAAHTTALRRPEWCTDACGLVNILGRVMRREQRPLKQACARVCTQQRIVREQQQLFRATARTIPSGWQGGEGKKSSGSGRKMGSPRRLRCTARTARTELCRRRTNGARIAGGLHVMPHSPRPGRRRRAWRLRFDAWEPAQTYGVARRRQVRGP